MGAQLKYTAKLNTDVVTRPAKKTFNSYAKRLNDQFLLEFTAPKWSWPGFTLRQNGSRAGPRRNIIDTGELINSQKFQMRGATTAIYQWNTPYATLVLRGFKHTNGMTYPSRDWVNSGIKALPAAQYISKALRGALR